MFRYVLFCVLIYTVLGYSSPRVFDEERIVGGYDVDIKDVPYQLALGQEIWLWFMHFCGASAISRKVGLTAAHCVEDGDSGLSVVHSTTKVGIFMEKTIRIKTAIRHPTYSEKTMRNDIALIIFKTELPMGDVVKPIALPDKPVEPGMKLLVSGWGTTSEGAWVQSGTLQAVEVPVLDREICSKDYPGAITGSMFCCGYIDGEKDSCQGDSGGPIAADGKIYGVISWGNGCARPKQPGVYTEVYIFKDWINEKVGDLLEE